jgi:hypothetical protein
MMDSGHVSGGKIHQDLRHGGRQKLLRRILGHRPRICRETCTYAYGARFAPLGNMSPPVP